jgi:outer membrane lipoprotein-sorting protein
MRRKILFFVLALGFLFNMYAVSQTADEIIEKNFKAKGGLNKLKSIKTIRLTGKFSMPPMGIEEAPITIIAKRPNLIRMDIEVMGMVVVRAFDGKTAWQTMPTQMGDLVTEEMPENDAKEMKRDSDFDGHLIDYRKKGHKVELIGKEDTDGIKVYNLKVTLKDGYVVNYYFNTENYLEQKSRAKTSFQGQDMDGETFYGDYREVAGILFAHLVEMKLDGQTSQQVIFEKVELNVDVKDDYFKMPAIENTEKMN